ncbi:hypothetical protein [Bacillus sp. D386]|uniref:hypothetical protein n=1 Tax=Bacillus sp. D386 TaxID=2587155 RepID=UPI0011239931|nr:hypothetical protein [Bacillus sp. D386]
MSRIAEVLKQFLSSIKDLINDILTFIYYSGLLFIIGWTLYQLLWGDVKPLPISTAVPPTWWTEYVIKPLISSTFLLTILKGIFLLSVWIILFLIIPSTTRQLKRFKLFQMEFEVEDKETAAVAFIELQSSKATLLSAMYSDASIGKLFTFLDEETMEVNYFSALDYFLEDFKISYKQRYNIAFECETKDLHQLIGVEREYAILSKETGDPEVLNWEVPLVKIKKNRLVFHFNYRGTDKVTILSSYSSQFDVIDKQNILFLHYALMYQAENIEYALMVEKEEWPFAKTPN